MNHNYKLLTDLPDYVLYRIYEVCMARALDPVAYRLLEDVCFELMIRDVEAVA
jgi:hypothetical protein